MASSSQVRLRTTGGSSSALPDGGIVAVTALIVGGADVDADADAAASPSAVGGADAGADVAANPGALAGAEARATGCGAGLGAANPPCTLSMGLDNNTRKHTERLQVAKLHFLGKLGFQWGSNGAVSELCRGCARAMLGLRRGCAGVSMGLRRGCARVVTRLRHGSDRVVPGQCRRCDRAMTGLCGGYAWAVRALQ